LFHAFQLDAQWFIRIESSSSNKSAGIGSVDLMTQIDGGGHAFFTADFSWI